MITKILLIRHAISIGNATGVIHGDTDFPLSEKGYEEVKNLTERLKTMKIDMMYSSPLIRAKETIQPISEVLNKKVKIEKDLKEMHLGTSENVSIEEFEAKYPGMLKKIIETEHLTGIEGQEETSDVAKRMLNAITKIAKENAGKTILIMSHAAAIGAFLCDILDIPFEQTKLKLGGIPNTSITFIEHNNIEDKFEVLKIGDNLHNE